eukprot:12798-Heterococcus_DN1.PRE.7
MSNTLFCENATIQQRGDVSAADEEQECIALHRGSAILAVMTAHPMDARTQETGWRALILMDRGRGNTDNLWGESGAAMLLMERSLELHRGNSAVVTQPFVAASVDKGVMCRLQRAATVAAALFLVVAMLDKLAAQEASKTAQLHRRKSSGSRKADEHSSKAGDKGSQLDALREVAAAAAARHKRTPSYEDDQEERHCACLRRICPTTSSTTTAHMCFAAVSSLARADTAAANNAAAAAAAAAQAEALAAAVAEAEARAAAAAAQLADAAAASTASTAAAVADAQAQAAAAAALQLAQARETAAAEHAAALARAVAATEAQSAAVAAAVVVAAVAAEAERQQADKAAAVL